MLAWLSKLKAKGPESDKKKGMSNEQTWVEALNISPEMLADWSAQAEEGVPLLVWCLEHGHVPAGKYFEWAKEHFQIPHLRSDFFEHGFDTQLLNSIRQSETWSAWCYPISQWDDVTVVACVEPPSEMPTGLFVYVLADPSAMRSKWDSTDHGSSAQPPEPPAGLTLNPTKSFKLNLDEGSFVIGDPNTAVAPEIPPLPMPEIEDDAAPDLAPQQITAVKRAPELSGDESNQIEQAFAKLKEAYDCALIMRCHNNTVSPYKWDSSLKLTDEMSVSLDQPSLFRIAAKTVRPYHGYVVDSPAHRDFFTQMGFKTLPECVTAVPIVIDKSLAGMLVAVGPGDAQNMETLAQAEKLAKELSAVLEQSWSRAA